MTTIAPRRRRQLAAACIGLAVCILPACGGSSGVPSDSVAKVGNKDVTKDDLASLMTRAKAQYVAQKRTFPKIGSPEYAQLQQQAIAQLVQTAELRIGADQLHISVSDSDINSRLDQIKKQYFPAKTGGGVDETKYQAALKQEGMSESQLKDQIAEQLREQKIFNAVTKSVAVSNSDITKYYDQNKKTLYTTPATRHVRHILVKTKALAEKLYSQLRLSDKNFAKDAKKYSQDKPGSAEKGGDLGDIQQGQTVPPFDKVAFDIAPNIVSRPVKTQFGYHLIEALGPVNPSATKPLNTTLKKQIQTQLQQTKKQQALSTWYQNLKKNLDKKVTYAKGYQPPTTATTPTGAGTTT